MEHIFTTILEGGLWCLSFYLFQLARAKRKEYAAIVASKNRAQEIAAFAKEAELEKMKQAIVELSALATQFKESMEAGIIKIAELEQGLLAQDGTIKVLASVVHAAHTNGLDKPAYMREYQGSAAEGSASPTPAPYPRRSLTMAEQIQIAREAAMSASTQEGN